MIDRRSVLVGAGALGACATLPARTPAAGWAGADAILGRIKPPRFPARRFPITDFGARPGADAQPAVTAAIAACVAAGGGRVVIPAGTWRMDGPITLESRVELHLETGALVRFSLPDVIKLPMVLTRWEGTELYNHSPLIYARGATGIAVTGPGTFDGQGKAGFFTWRPKQKPDQNLLRKMGAEGVPVEQRRFGEGHYLRPGFLQFMHCQDVLIDGPTFVDSPFWVVHPVYCNNVTVRNVTVVNRHLNSDGVDPDSCTDVLIERYRFDVSDDCVAIKSGRDQDGWRMGRPTRGVVVRDCEMRTDIAAAFAIGSEMSGGASDIYVERLTVPHAEHAIYFKANLDRGGVIERVRVRSITVAETKSLIQFTTAYHSWRGGNFPPTYRDFVVSDVSCRKAEQALHIVGVPSAPVRDVTLSNVTVAEATKPDAIAHAVGLKLDAVRVNGRALVSPV